MEGKFDALHLCQMPENEVSSGLQSLLSPRRPCYLSGVRPLRPVERLVDLVDRASSLNFTTIANVVGRLTAAEGRDHDRENLQRAHQREHLIERGFELPAKLRVSDLLRCARTASLPVFDL